jgi:hypothetical protein
VIVMPCDAKSFPDAALSRCLLYVAISRASDRLMLVIPPSNPSPLFRIEYRELTNETVPRQAAESARVETYGRWKGALESVGQPGIRVARTPFRANFDLPITRQLYTIDELPTIRTQEVVGPLDLRAKRKDRRH